MSLRSRKPVGKGWEVSSSPFGNHVYVQLCEVYANTRRDGKIPISYPGSSQIFHVRGKDVCGSKRQAYLLAAEIARKRMQEWEEQVREFERRAEEPGD